MDSAKGLSQHREGALPTGLPQSEQVSRLCPSDRLSEYELLQQDFTARKEQLLTFLTIFDLSSILYPIWARGGIYDQIYPYA